MFIFLVDANPLISDWLQKLASKKEQRFYHLPSLDQSAFFVDDLRPDVLVLDGATAMQSEGTFVDSIKDFPFLKDVPVVGLGQALPEWAGVFNMKGHIPKPLDPSKFYEQVKALL